MRRDLEEMITTARAAGLYVNLITSGLGLTRDRLAALVKAGLDHIQLSFQDAQEASANDFAGIPAHAHKLRVASWIREHRIAFTVNIVVHRRNIARLADDIQLAEQLHADKLEIANVQYYGWALRNRDQLLPSLDQLRASLPIIEAARARLAGKMRIDYVLPDYYAKYPKACMGGWGRSLMLIDPAGRCHALPFCACHSGTCFSQHPRPHTPRNLGTFAAFSAFSRRSLDAGTLQLLRTQKHRLRRMSLPGPAARR